MTRDEWWANCPMDTSDRLHVMTRVLADQKWREQTGWGSALIDWYDSEPSGIVQDGERPAPNDSTWAPTVYSVTHWERRCQYTPRDMPRGGQR